MRAGFNPGRRHLLRTVGAGLATGLAGCLGGGSSTPFPTPTADSVFEAVSIEGGTLVVDLREDHDVSRLNLIAPDGTLFESVDVATGVTRAEIMILDVMPDSPRYKHYSPGVNELVAVVGENTESLELHLEPDLYVVEIRQIRQGEPSDYADIIVVIGNEGTGPTWIYDITYQNAPNFTVNNPLVPVKGVPNVTTTSGDLNIIIQPGSVKEYLGGGSPLLIYNGETQTCEDVFDMTVSVGSIVSGTITAHLQVEFGGSVLVQELGQGYTCSQIQLSLLDENSDIAGNYAGERP